MPDPEESDLDVQTTDAQAAEAVLASIKAGPTEPDRAAIARLADAAAAQGPFTFHVSINAAGTITRTDGPMSVFKHPGVAGTYSVVALFPFSFAHSVPVASFGSTDGTTSAPNGGRIALYQPPLDPVFGTNAVQVIIRNATGNLQDSPFHLAIGIVQSVL